MKNIYDVIRQKEMDMQQLQKEVEALRLAARLLADDGDSSGDTYATKTTTTAAGITAPRPQTGKTVDAGFATARDNGIRQFP